MTLIFGEPWDAPICEDATVLPEVPVYAACLSCGVQFSEGDSGVAMPILGRVDPNHLIGVAGSGGRLVAEHRECHLASVVGHLVGVCSCTGWEPFSRAAALEVWRRVDAGALHHSRKPHIDTTGDAPTRPETEEHHTP